MVTGHLCLLLTTAHKLVTDVDSELAQLPPVLPGCVGGGAGAWPGLILPIIGERRHGAQQISAYVHKYTLVATTAIHAHNKRSQIYYLKDRTNNGLDITMIRLYVKTTNLDNFSCFVYTGNSFKSVEWCFNCVPYSTVRGLLNEGQLN